MRTRSSDIVGFQCKFIRTGLPQNWKSRKRQRNRKRSGKSGKSQRIMQSFLKKKFLILKKFDMRMSHR